MKYTEVDILNYMDGRLNDSQTAEFLATLRTDPGMARAVAAMQSSQLAIGQAYQQVQLPPVPGALRALVDELVLDAKVGQANLETVSPKPRNQFGAGMLTAAGLFFGLCLGALLSQGYLHTNNSNSSASLESLGADTPASVHDRLVKRVTDYQSLYVENTVASVIQTRVENAQALLNSIHQRTSAYFPIVDFSSFGYEFARAQELGFEGQVLVQLVYRKPGSAPLALCFMPSTNTASRAMSVSQQHQLHAASWIASSQHFVLVADESQATMKQLYQHALNKL